MLYAIIRDNKIDTILNSGETLTKLRKYGDIRPIDSGLVQYAGTDARAIDWTTQTIKPLSQQIEEGIATVPEGFIFENGSFRAMTYTERIEAGMNEMPDGYKITNGVLEPMTLNERYDAGQITIEQYNASIRAQRQTRYAMEADPLYMEYLYDKEIGKDFVAKYQAWVGKISEIKADLPLKAE